MIYSLAQLVALGLPPAKLIELAAHAGYDAVGLRLTEIVPGGPYWPLHVKRELMRDALVAKREFGVEVLDVEAIRLLRDSTAKEFEPVLVAAAELGARHVLTVGVESTDADRLSDLYAGLCDLAAQYDVTVDLEFMPWVEVKDLIGAAALVKRAGRASAGVLIDTLHFFRSNSELKALEGMPADWFHYVQLCDAPAAPPANLEEMLFTAREARLAPGDGGLDLAGVLRRLPRETPISLECPNTARVAAIGLEAYASEILQKTRRYVEAAHAAAPRQPAPSGWARR